jgi:hypothetical protein
MAVHALVGSLGGLANEGRKETTGILSESVLVDVMIDVFS